MKWVAVTTVRDEGAAQVARDSLDSRGIPVELKRMMPNAYLGSATPAEIEVRVPEDRADDAHQVLEGLEAELEQAMLAEAGVPPEEGEPTGAKLPPPEERPKKISWAIALALVFPVPCMPAGMMYARAPLPLSMTILGLSGALMLIGKGEAAVFAIFGSRALDLILAPVFAVRENRRLQRLGVAVPATRLPVPVIMLIGVLVAAFATGFYLTATRTLWSPEKDAAQP